VARTPSNCLRQDRARIQVGRISHFGLLEMSRQRIRASVLESSTEPCAQCGGTGHVRSVSSVALQLLRGIEEILMKGATHNLNVRTRTDVALYVLNHKRGHLRDLESSFKVSLAVVADATVSGQQSFIIDRGEQVHTLEAAKALLAAQAASAPSQQEDDFEDEDEGLDAETESEIETEETEGLDEQPAAEEASGEGDGQRRRRRRRRRGRGGEAREGGPQPRDDAEMVQAAMAEPADASTDDTFSEEEESDEQPAFAGADQGQNGERRPRRRGRRGGRRRRGGRDDGLAGSISDELAPPSAHEATDAVADFDGGPEPAPSPVQQPEPAAPAFQPETAEQPQPQPVAAPAAAAEEPAADEKAARRRSTVREKVSFMSSPPPDTAPATPAAVEHAAPAAAPEETGPDTSDQPRKAGWWSRRFGG
jgi:ribonuclease E